MGDLDSFFHAQHIKIHNAENLIYERKSFHANIGYAKWPGDRPKEIAYPNILWK